MSVPQRAAAAIAAAAFVCSTAYAPIYGTYPGLHSLIKQSEVIAAATVLEALPEIDIGGGERYKIEFIKVLKGSPAQKQAIAWLRPLEITPPGGGAWPLGSPGPIHYFAPTEQHDLFRPGNRYVLFLVRSQRGDGTPYENVNYEGSSFPISPLRDVGQLKVESLPDTLILLFREYLDFKRTELKNLEQQLNVFVHEDNK